jgi:hypothetical protein
VVELTGETDLKQVAAAVNFYGGESPNGVSGEVRVLFDGKLYQGKFKLPAPKGNKGADGDKPDGSPAWQVLNIPQIVGLNH